MEMLKDEGRATAKVLAMLDMKHELRRLKSTYEVVFCDWNTCPPGAVDARGAQPTAEQRRDTKEVECFMNELGLVEPLSRPDAAGLWGNSKSRLGGMRSSKVRTFHGRGASWVDYFAVSKKLEDRGLVKAVAVLGEGLNDSDHRAVAIDIDLEAALGKSSVWEDIRQAQKEARETNMNAVFRFRTIKLREPGKVREFQEELREQWPEQGGLMERVQKMYDDAVQQSGDQQREEGRAKEGEVKREASALMGEAVRALLEAQRKVHSRLPKAGKKFKHVSTEGYCKLATGYRVQRRLVGAPSRRNL